MDRRALLAAFGAFMGAGCSLQFPWSGPDDVSLINLIATPEKFGGRRIRVIGYLHLEFEGNALYLDQQSFSLAITKNSVWIYLPERETKAKQQSVSDKYALVQGRFDARDRGHMEMCAGAIGSIERLEPWPFRNGKPGRD